MAVGPSALRDATTNIQFEIPTKIHFPGDPKMAAKFVFSGIGDRDILRDPKKYTFGKTNFKTFFKNQKSQILPPFLSTLDT